MASSSASPNLSSKAVSISEQIPEVALPERSAGGGYRPAHLLRKSVSSRRLQGRLPSSPRLENDHQLHQHAEAAGGVEPGVLDRAAELLEKCAQWLESERHKRRARRARRKERGEESAGSADESLDLLEALLRERPGGGSRKSSHRGSRRNLLGGSGAAAAASDTEYASDGDAVVPGCEEWLKIPEEIGWDAFKLEVLKLTHTLRCKGWRRVELDRYKEVGVERISGALTNVVSCGGSAVVSYG